MNMKERKTKQVEVDKASNEKLISC